MEWRLLLCFLLLWGTSQLSFGQTNNAFNARMSLRDVDTTARVACYDLQISSANEVEWILGSFNIIMLYDARVACYRSDTLLLNDILYDYGINTDISSTAKSDLPYRDSLGFIRLNLTSLDQAAIFDTARTRLDSLGSWESTIGICFDLKIDDIIDPTTCMQLNFSSPELESSLSIPPNFMQEWAGGLIYVNVDDGTLIDIIPDRTYNSCFVLSENTQKLCTDGIDNDENGLIDCSDTEGCAPGQVSIVPTFPTCQAPLGSLVIRGGSGVVRYSIDGGVTFGSDSIFSALQPGVYNVLVQRGNVQDCAFDGLIILNAVDCLESSDATCSDGIDNDGDGLIDCADIDCIPIISQLLGIGPDNCPDLDNGSLSYESPNSNLEWSLDGTNYTEINTFDSLSAGTYMPLFRNVTSLCFPIIEMSILITPPLICPVLEEICNDGIDNDINGLVDCEDPFCNNDPSCIIPAAYYIANVFSPSSSNNNALKINVNGNQPWSIIQFSIYDRWGNQIHNRINTSTQDASHAWDGMFNNQQVNPGVYFYHAKLTQDGRKIQVSGDVTVVN
ncbi:MAG: gliding motility-associated-like protein [Saprospiraceae bacterium]|jgi:gliding motility-associated-like protein